MNVCANTSKNGLNKWKDWQSKSKGFIELPFGISGLEEVDESLNTMCNGSPTPTLVAQKIGFEHLRSCQKWFRSEFFELYIHQALQQAIGKISGGFAKPLRGIHCTMDIQTPNDLQNSCDVFVKTGAAAIGALMGSAPDLARRVSSPST